MKITDGVKSAIAMVGKRQTDLAAGLGKTKQNMSMKATRDTWSARDLVRVARFVGADLTFTFPDGSVIKLDFDEPEKSDEEDV